MKSAAPTPTPDFTANPHQADTTQEVYETFAAAPLGRQLAGQLRQHAPQAANLATRAGTLAGKAALWLALWAISALTGLILFIMMLAGYHYAGPLLLLLLVGTGFTVWQQLSRLGQRVQSIGLQQPSTSKPNTSKPSASTSSADRESADHMPDPRTRQVLSELRRLLSSSKVGALQDKLDYTGNLVAEALKATATQGGLITRDTHDARAAAERDLPQALQTFYAATRSGVSASYAEVLLAEQLELVQNRMLEILRQHSGAHLRDLEAQRAFLKDKYSL